MYRKTTLALAALAMIALGGTANAYTFSPKSTKFSATGTLSLSALGTTVQCHSAFKGKVNATGAASITGVTFSGTSSVCSLITPTALPWHTMAKSTSTAVIKSVTVTGGGGVCGPTNVTIGVSSGGAFTFNNATLSGGCGINGSVQTSPVVTITNP